MNSKTAAARAVEATTALGIAVRIAHERGIGKVVCLQLVEALYDRLQDHGPSQGGPDTENSATVRGGAAAQGARDTRSESGAPSGAR